MSISAEPDETAPLRVPAAALRKVVHALANEGAAISGIGHLLRADPPDGETKRLLERLDARSRTIQEQVKALRRLITSARAEHTTRPFGRPTEVEVPGHDSLAVADTRPSTVGLDGEAPPPLAKEDVIDGTYVIEAPLGEGAMGTVYRARDLALSRPVALKLLTASYWARPAARDAFLREARSLARIRHPNVVGIHAFGTRDDNLFIIMDLIDGPTLRALLRQTPLELSRALALLVQLCNGLGALHAAGIVHRDIKPANLMVDRGGRLSITDLGLALPLDTRLDPTVHLRGGTPGYSAPEVFRRDRDVLTRAVDVYGVGAVAFELLGGHHAFPAATPQRRLEDQQRGPHRTLASLAPHLPAELTEMVDACMSPDPRARPADVESVENVIASAAATSVGFEDLHVVVVDDDPDTLEHTVALLRTELRGCSVAGFRHSPDALRAIDGAPPDALVTDLDMPAMDGRSLIQRVRLRSDVPILVVSGVGGPTAWPRLRRAGADAFLPKPLDSRSLGAVVRSLVGVSPAGAAPASSMQPSGA